MRLVLRIDGSCVRRWHLQLLERLGAIAGLQASVALSAGQPPGGDFDRLFRLEALIHGVAMDGPAALLPAAALAPYRAEAGFEADLTLDLCGGADAGDARHWRLAFDEVAGERALLNSLLAGRAPLAEIIEGERLVAAGRLGTENGHIVLAAFTDVLERLTSLIVAALSGYGTAVPALPGEEPVTGSAAALGTGALAKVAAKELARGSRGASIAVSTRLRTGGSAGASWMDRTCSICAGIRTAVGAHSPMTVGGSTPTRSRSCTTVRSRSSSRTMRTTCRRASSPRSPSARTGRLARRNACSSRIAISPTRSSLHATARSG